VINDLTFTEIEGILNENLKMPDDEEIVPRCLTNSFKRSRVGRMFCPNVIDKKNTATFVEEIGDSWQSSVDSLDETLRTKISDIICAWGSEAVDDKLDRKISENENKIDSFEKEIEGIESKLRILKSILVEINRKVEQIRVN
jgi:chaperonin cofactor prefoldin